jgi:hypothetical protein
VNDGSRRERRTKQGSSERLFGFIMAGGYEQKLLEIVEQARDTVSSLIGPKVADGRLFRFAFSGRTGLNPWVRKSRDPKHMDGTSRITARVAFVVYDITITTQDATQFLRDQHNVLISR